MSQQFKVEYSISDKIPASIFSRWYYTFKIQFDIFPSNNSQYLNELNRTLEMFNRKLLSEEFTYKKYSDKIRNDMILIELFEEPEVRKYDSGEYGLSLILRTGDTISKDSDNTLKSKLNERFKYLGFIEK